MTRQGPDTYRGFRDFDDFFPIVFEDFPNEAYKTTIQVALVGSDPPDVFFNWSGENLTISVIFFDGTAMRPATLNSKSATEENLRV